MLLEASTQLCQQILNPFVNSGNLRLPGSRITASPPVRSPLVTITIGMYTLEVISFPNRMVPAMPPMRPKASWRLLRKDVLGKALAG